MGSNKSYLWEIENKDVAHPSTEELALIAACQRWIDFTDRRAVMIIVRDGYVKWERARKSALRSGIFVQSGMPITDDALKPFALTREVSCRIGHFHGRQASGASATDPSRCES